MSLSSRRTAAVRAMSCSTSLTEVQQLGELRPGRHQGPADHLVRAGSLAGPDERAAAAAAPCGHVTGRLEALQRLTHRGPAHLEHGGQLPLGRQPLAGDELTERDGRDEPLRDALPRGLQRDRRQQRAERFRLGRAGRPGDGHDRTCWRPRARGVPGRPPAAKNPAIVRAPRTMLASSTASSGAWMLRAVGP
jgi:hypothetical protein